MNEKKAALRHITMTLAPMGVHDLAGLTERLFMEHGLSAANLHPAVIYRDAVKASQGPLSGPGRVSDEALNDIDRIRDLCNADHLLRTASKSGQVEAVLAALELGANPNAPDLLGHTSVHFAVGDRHRHLVKPLVEAGADLNVQGGWSGATPLHMAAKAGDAQTCLVLMAYGADAKILDDLGRSAADLARLGMEQRYEQAPGF